MLFSILQRALYKELFATFLAVFLVLLLITFGSEVTRVLAQAVRGDLPADIVFDVLSFKILRTFELLVPLVSLITIMLVFGRMHKDHEMVVMQSCGVSPKVLQKSVSVFFVPIMLVLFWISLVVVPWSFQQERLLLNEALSKGIYSNIEPGQFNELPNSQGSLYAKSVSVEGDLIEVWVKYHTPQSDMLLVAQTGRILKEQGKMILQLENGWRYENLHQAEQASKAIEVQQFASFEGVLPQVEGTQRNAKEVEKNLFQLLQGTTANDQALLHWRLSVPLGVLIMGLVGLRLSKTGPRQGRFGKLFIALLLFVIYNQLTMNTNEATENGSNPWMIWLWPILFLLWALGADQWLRQRFLMKSVVQNTLQKSMPKDKQ